jgi:hypothetical protein
MERCLACETESVGTVETCLACEAVVSRAEGRSGRLVGCALWCEESRLS